jgi:hypothetical protein
MTNHRSAPLRLMLPVLFACAFASAAAQVSVKPGGAAGKTPAKVNVFVIMDKEGQGADLIVKNMILPEAISLYAWASFKLGHDGSVEYRAEASFPADILKSADVPSEAGFRAYQVALSGAKPSGGKLYAVSFGRSDMELSEDGQPLAQPAAFAIMAAVRKAGRPSGHVRVLGASLSGGRFSYKIALK